MCDKHYRRFQRHGDAEVFLKRRDKGDEVERFWAKVDKTSGAPCWLWLGVPSRGGYGVHYDDQGAHRLAHVFSWELHVGPVPEGLELDHVVTRGCISKLCVNPAHLEPVTHGENVRRGKAGMNNLAKTHCSHGHEFTPENTIIRGTHRQCRECGRIATRAYMANKREAAKV